MTEKSHDDLDAEVGSDAGPDIELGIHLDKVEADHINALGYRS
jgi:hypothetical protein